MYKHPQGVTRRRFMDHALTAGAGLAALSAVGPGSAAEPSPGDGPRIKSIDCVRVQVPQPKQRTKPRRPVWSQDLEVANPMSQYPKYKRHRSSWRPKWENVWVKVTADDGTWGLGTTSAGPPVRAVVEGHFAPLLLGESVLALEKCWDMMFRLSKPYGTVGLATLAQSAVDLALWDCAGKLLKKPVYALLGGKVRDRLFTYATGNDVDWYRELGFRAVKLPCQYGPADGLDGIRKNEQHVAQMRNLIGDDAELMLDCYMAFDVEYSVRLAERLRPSRLKWIEECLIPEDLRGHRELRRRLPWQTLATGEHMYTPYPFLQLIEDQSVDILQPDILWCGGLTACRRIALAAATAGLQVILHAGNMYPYGAHFTAASPCSPWLEHFFGPYSAPGVPLEEGKLVPGCPVPRDGFVELSDEPGFGLGIAEKWLQPFH
jgi:L-rhamnonate dehydratase